VPAVILILPFIFQTILGQSADWCYYDGNTSCQVSHINVTWCL